MVDDLVHRPLARGARADPGLLPVTPSRNASSDANASAPLADLPRRRQGGGASQVVVRLRAHRASASHSSLPPSREIPLDGIHPEPRGPATLNARGSNVIWSDSPSTMPSTTAAAASGPTPGTGRRARRARRAPTADEGAVERRVHLAQARVVRHLAPELHEDDPDLAVVDGPPGSRGPGRGAATPGRRRCGPGRPARGGRGPRRPPPAPRRGWRACREIVVQDPLADARLARDLFMVSRE